MEKRITSRLFRARTLPAVYALVDRSGEPRFAAVAAKRVSAGVTKYYAIIRGDRVHRSGAPRQVDRAGQPIVHSYRTEPGGANSHTRTPRERVKTCPRRCVGVRTAVLAGRAGQVQDARGKTDHRLFHPETIKNKFFSIPYYLLLLLLIYYLLGIFCIFIFYNWLI